MFRSSPPTALSITFRMVGSLLGLLWGGFLIWYGWGMMSDPGYTGEQQGGFSFVAGGMLFAVPSLISLFYNALRRPKPTARQDVGQGEVARSDFDADDAIARYLANRPATPSQSGVEEPGAAPDAPTTPIRPVFGRRQPSSSSSS